MATGQEINWIQPIGVPGRGNVGDAFAMVQGWPQCARGLASAPSGQAAGIKTAPRIRRGSGSGFEVLQKSIRRFDGALDIPHENSDVRFNAAHLRAQRPHGLRIEIVFEVEDVIVQPA